MAAIRFSRRAEADLLSIGDYTLRTWGEKQAIRYLDDLETCCQMLADNPRPGRACDYIRPWTASHGVRPADVFYREDTGGILVSRILHQRTLPQRQAIDDDDDGPRPRFLENAE